jgi:hypothetical protein
MITRVFWTVFALEAIAYVILLIWIARAPRSGPEGPVGGIVLLFPPVILVAVGATGYFSKSDPTKLVCTGILVLPLVQLVLGPLYTKFTDYRVNRSLAGDDTFRKPAQRDLAHAIRAHDAAAAKSLIPGAGNLNTLYEGETLLRFAVSNVDPQNPASKEIVKALLDAGADPNIPSFSTFPLTMAFFAGPDVTGLLLNAGADPNLLDSAGRPLWWDAISPTAEPDLQNLKILLEHGADVTKRDSESGPVGYAADRKCWRAMWLLIERGAEWKDEKRYGQSVLNMLLYDLQYREGSHSDVPEEMRKALAKLTAAQ